MTPRRFVSHGVSSDTPNGTRPMPRTNRPHYHVWIESRTNPFMRYAWRQGFGTRQNARKYALRRGLDPERFSVAECWRPECAPKLPD